MQQLYPTLDFKDLTLDSIQAILHQHQLSLTPEEALLIQNQILKRPPTLAECHLWSIQGSEHCSYKSSRKYLKQLSTQGPHVISGAKEDAGIVAVATDKMGNRYGIVLSHESHNHPSQLVPYEGAATGVGGNMRDVCCMGAEVIAVADGLRFGDLNQQKTHWIYEGVIAGIGGYGNATGIPNIAGDIYFDKAYNDNCLVTVVTLGVVAEKAVIHSFAPAKAAGYVYILVGKATDNSGFGGASFASADLVEGNQTANKGAVQEPDAFLKRHLLKANYALFTILQEKGLTDQVGFKDLGAGGIACAAVELADAAGYGAELNMDNIPAGMDDLPAHVIQAKAEDITRGIQYDRPVEAKTYAGKEPVLSEADPNQILLQLLAHENIASRQPLLETYDKQVQGRTLLEAGEADAGVLIPFNEDKYPPEIQQTGIALSLDQNPRYNAIDAYWGAVNAVIESARNVVAVGATPVSISDCLCFGNPSPMIACLGSMPDASLAISAHFQQSDSVLIMLGARKDECGGSIYYQLHQTLGRQLPKPDLVGVAREIHTLTKAIQRGLILSAHDISEGGIAVALAEMSFKNTIGLTVQIPGDLSPCKKLFTESGGFVLEVAPHNLDALTQFFKQQQLPFWKIGHTSAEPQLCMDNSINLSLETAKYQWENGLKEKLL